MNVYTYKISCILGRPLPVNDPNDSSIIFLYLPVNHFFVFIFGYSLFFWFSSKIEFYIHNYIISKKKIRITGKFGVPVEFDKKYIKI